MTMPPLHDKTGRLRSSKPRRVRARAMRANGWWLVTVRDDRQTQVRVQHLDQVDAVVGRALAGMPNRGESGGVCVHIDWYTAP